jgi:putative methionine-R-sulfoxide reductase with GAF domain
MLSNEDSLRAPSIRLRLPARQLRVLLFIFCAILIGYFSGQIIKSTLGIATLSIWVFVNTLAWGWELLYIYQRSPALLIASESAVQQRYQTRVVVFWIVVAANFILMLVTGQGPSSQAGIVTFMVILYNLFNLAWLQYDALRWFRWPKIEKWFLATTLFWISVALLFGFVAFISLRNAVDDPFLVFGIAVMTAAIAVIVFIMQRLEVEDHVQASVIRNLSNNILGVSHTAKQWNEIVQLIGDRLRYKRVYILEPSMEAGKLKIVGQYGDGPDFIGKDVPIDQGITGRSFRTGEVLAWNDVRECDYYYPLLDKSLDDAKSEIAIPIQYLGIPYGILDVQDTQAGVFRRQDVRSLEVIARILGAALSAQKSDSLVDDAYNLWEELSRESYNEEDIFREFARFAKRKLGADLVGYYPLSPAGYPISAPFIEGKLNYPERMKGPVSRPDSMLFQLIREWHPQFIEIAEQNSLFSGYEEKEPSHFSIREQVKSVCFIPIGTPKERLGAMFLNFRQPRKFDGLFKFVVLNFSQTFAMLAIRNRYRAILIEGYGRPELGIHNLFSRYGLKIGVVDEGAKIFENSCRQMERNTFADCGMLELLKRVDSFLYAANMVDASIPPLFWRQSLLGELEQYASALPPSQQRGPKPSTKISIDPKIEREGSWAKLAIYRVITEAMNNAIFHAGTKEIMVKAQRQAHGISVQIVNDGNPIPDSAGERRSRRGIFSLLRELEQRFSAKTNIQKGPEGKGTVVDVLIPVIPLNHEV